MRDRWKKSWSQPVCQQNLCHHIKTSLPEADSSLIAGRVCVCAWSLTKSCWMNEWFNGCSELGKLEASHLSCSTLLPLRQFAAVTQSMWLLGRFHSQSRTPSVLPPPKAQSPPLEQSFLCVQRKQDNTGRWGSESYPGLPTVWGAAPGQWSTNRGSQGTHGSFNPGISDKQDQQTLGTRMGLEVYNCH